MSVSGLGLVLGTLATAGAVAAAPVAHHAALPRVIGSARFRPGPGIRPLATQAGPGNQAESTNWSGYAATGRTYTSVSADWVESAGTCGGGDSYAAFWVGLDGYHSTTVEQTGSEVDCVGQTARYYSFYEMYPADPIPFTDPVNPGDHLHGSVTFNGGSSYTLVLQDTTQGWSHTVTASLSGTANFSAEAIAEAPCCTASRGILPLTQFSPVTFTGVTANGSAIGSFSPARIIMVDSAGQDMDAISPLDGGSSFTATWLQGN